ncbi:hypothetical protein BT93_H0008 [Corymbia citriodora subsp. variegata]|nr:hypothetical protein BT93_H0008 [Corymbia citriodora subsp. variegata]
MQSTPGSTQIQKTIFPLQKLLLQLGNIDKVLRPFRLIPWERAGVGEWRDVSLTNCDIEVLQILLFPYLHGQITASPLDDRASQLPLHLFPSPNHYHHLHKVMSLCGGD